MGGEFIVVMSFFVVAMAVLIVVARRGGKSWLEILASNIMMVALLVAVALTHFDAPTLVRWIALMAVVGTIPVHLGWAMRLSRSSRRARIEARREERLRKLAASSSGRDEGTADLYLALHDEVDGAEAERGEVLTLFARMAPAGVLAVIAVSLESWLLGAGAAAMIGWEWFRVWRAPADRLEPPQAPLDVP